MTLPLPSYRATPTFLEGDPYPLTSCHWSNDSIPLFQTQKNDFQINRSEMSNLDVALAGFWQIARHWKNGDKAKIELFCEAGSLYMQLSAMLGHPDQPYFPHPPSHPPPLPPSSSYKKNHCPSSVAKIVAKRRQLLKLKKL